MCAEIAKNKRDCILAGVILKFTTSTNGVKVVEKGLIETVSRGQKGASVERGKSKEGLQSAT